MRMPLRYVYSALILAGIGALVAAWPTTQVDVIAVAATTGPVIRELITQSTLHAVATVDVNAAVSGEVQALEVEPDASVRAGDILARIDATPFEEALRSARTTLAYLKTDEEASAQSIADAETAVRAAARDLERVVVRAPVDGVIVLRNVSVGQIVTAGSGAPILYRIATDLRHLEVAVDVPRSEVGDLRPGSDVIVTLTARDRSELHGTIERVGPTTTIEVPNQDLRLQPGATVTATIVINRRDNVLRVPSDALAFAPPDNSASIVDRGGAAEPAENSASAPRELWRYQHGRLTPVAVRVGLSGEGWTEIDSGLEEGDEVATGVVARRASIWSTIWSL